MILRFKTALAGTALATAALTGAARAQSQPDPGEVAAALGVTVPQLTACIAPIRAAGERGGNPSRADRLKVRDCLQVANPSLTNAKMRSAMQAFRN